MIHSIHVSNFRCLALIKQLELPQIGVFFGPNGAGKTSLFDVIWLMHDCCRQGPKESLNERAQGFGLLRQSANENQIVIGVSDDVAQIELVFVASPIGLSSALKESVSYFTDSGWSWIANKDFAATRLEINHSQVKGLVLTPSFRDSDRLGILQVVSAEYGKKLKPLWDQLLRASYMHSRSLGLNQIKNDGANASNEFRLSKDGQNLWPLLRNLNDCRDSDVDGLESASRFDRILYWTKRAFPFFNGWKFEASGSNKVYAHAKINNVRDTIPVSQLADGVIQMTLLLVALFGEGTSPQLIMFDEPDLSLHTWALFVLSEAIQEATTKWNRQVLLATHSPVLLSHFPEESLFLMMPKDGATTIQRVSEMTENRDLLDQYAVGSLYMSQLIGAQEPKEPMVTLEKIDD